jgi:hypothetical protein
MRVRVGMYALACNISVLSLQIVTIVVDPYEPLVGS